MSWDLAAFAVPAVSFWKMLAVASPGTYKSFSELPHSERTFAVRRLAERILEAENVPGSPHYERIQDMLISKASISSLVESRFKVIDSKQEGFPAFTVGTDCEEGKYFIGLSVDLDVEAVPWVVSHEISHILNDYSLNLAIVKSIGSFAITSLALFGFGWPWWKTMGASVAVNALTHVVFFQRAERAADDFAIRHLSKAEIKKGIEFFEEVKRKKENETYSKRWLVLLLHLSENARIAKLQQALNDSNSR